MIITQTPVRVSFLGGGTDYPDYYKAHGGACIAASMNNYTTVTLHKLHQFSDYNYRVHYSLIESVGSLNEIKHPSARECLRFMDIQGGVEIYYASDLPARTGIGSSSSATVALLHALHSYKGELVSRDQLAKEAIHVEQNMIKERVGSQDQYACALGGFQYMEFMQTGEVRTTPILLTQKRIDQLQDNLMLVYTKQTRASHEVLEEQMQRMQAGQNIAQLHELKGLVKQGLDVLSGSGNLSQFGELLHQAWMLKRGFSSKVTNDSIDQAYEKALKAGAVGGKLLGAGGGGFLLLYVDPKNHNRVREALEQFPQAKFAFENFGSRVIFNRNSN